MSLVLTGLVIVLASVLLSLFILWLVRRLVPHQTLSPHNDVAGFVYATMAVTYAVLLGLALIALWEQFDNAQSSIDQEANTVAALQRLSYGLPDEIQLDIQNALHQYAHTVIDEEWPRLNAGDRPPETAMDSLDRIWAIYTSASIESDVQMGVYQESLDQMDRLASLRGYRLLKSDEGLLGIIWTALIVGALFTVLFPCIFGVENGGVHGVVIASLAALLGLLLFLAFELNHPYRGNVHVDIEGLEAVVARYDTDTPEFSSSTTVLPNTASYSLPGVSIHFDGSNVILGAF